jgi:hypothetical protein
VFSSPPDYQLTNLRVRVTLRLAVYGQSVRFGANPLRLMTSNFFQLNTCCCSPHATSSLTRGGVCHLRLLLVLASAVILRSESCGTHDHILLSQIGDSSNLVSQVPAFIPPGAEWPSYTPRHWVPFLLPPTARRGTVEVFEPTTTRDSDST